MQRDRLEKASYGSMLIVRFGALGDVAMTVPVVYSICAAYPDVRFTMVTGPAPARLFVNAPANLRVLSYDIRQDYNGFMGALRLSGELLSTGSYDACADLQGNRYTFAMAMKLRLKGVQVARINNDIKDKRQLTRSSNKTMLPLISQRARYREVFLRLGMTCNEGFESLYGSRKADPADFAAISGPKQAGAKWLAVAPFAKYPGKIYPIGLMEKVVEEISGHEGVRIFLFGAGAEESAQLEPWAARYAGVVNVASGNYGFAAELALLNHCDAIVCMDSANMHLASLVKLPAITIWGATHPYCGFMGWKQDKANIIQLNMACRPCSVFGNKPCKFNDHFCLSGIAPALIIEKVKSLIFKEK